MTDRRTHRVDCMFCAISLNFDVLTLLVGYVIENSDEHGPHR